MVAILSSVARGRPSYQWLSVVSFLHVAVDCFFGYLPPNLIFLFPPDGRARPDTFNTRHLLSFVSTAFHVRHGAPFVLPLLSLLTTPVVHIHLLPCPGKNQSECQLMRSPVHGKIWMG